MLRICWIETVNLDDVVPICRMCKLPQRGASFWRGVDPANATSKLKLYQRTEDCSNRSAPLLNYHASAPSVRADSIIYLCLSLSISIYIYMCMYVCIFISKYLYLIHYIWNHSRDVTTSTQTAYHQPVPNEDPQSKLVPERFQSLSGQKE